MPSQKLIHKKSKTKKESTNHYGFDVVTNGICLWTITSVRTTCIFSKINLMSECCSAYLTYTGIRKLLFVDYWTLSLWFGIYIYVYVCVYVHLCRCARVDAYAKKDTRKYCFQMHSMAHGHCISYGCLRNTKMCETNASDSSRWFDELINVLAMHL